MSVWGAELQAMGAHGLEGGRLQKLGEAEMRVQLCLTSREHLQPKICLAALLPEVNHMGELVLGKGMGSGGPRSLGGHGR